MTLPAPDEPRPAGPDPDESGPVRRRILTEKEIHLSDPQRSGCLRWGAILGIVAGVLVAFLVVPPCMRWAFQPEQVGVGETFEHEGLKARVTTTTFDAAAREWVVTLDVTPSKTWHAGVDDVHLELADGEKLEPVEGTVAPSKQVALGETGPVVLRFADGTNAEQAEKLILDDPQVDFDLAPGAP